MDKMARLVKRWQINKNSLHKQVSMCTVECGITACMCVRRSHPLKHRHMHSEFVRCTGVLHCVSVCMFVVCTTHLGAPLPVAFLHHLVHGGGMKLHDEEERNRAGSRLLHDGRMNLGIKPVKEESMKFDYVVM